MIIQVPRGGAVDRQLRAEAPAQVASGEVVIEAAPPDPEGNLVPPDAGEVVLSVPSPEALRREEDEVHRVIAQAGTGAQPLVVVIEAAEELREDELALLVDAAQRSSRAVIVRIIRDG